MKCSYCGAELTSGSAFCDNCGAVVPGRQVESDEKLRHNKYGTHNEKNDSTMLNKGIFILVLIIIFLSCVLIALLIMNIRKANGSYNSYDYEYENVISESDKYDNRSIPTVTPESVIREPVFTSAISSSVRGTDTEGGQYSTDAVLTTDKETKWVPQKNTNGGISEWIQVNADSIQQVQGIEILNGYHKSYEIWKNNNRVKNCTITFSNGESRDFVLDDTMDLIRLDLGDVIETTSIRLTINSIYNGAKWNDTAITYIGAY